MIPGTTGASASPISGLMEDLPTFPVSPYYTFLDDLSTERVYLLETTVKDAGGTDVDVRLSSHTVTIDGVPYDAHIVNPLNFGISLFQSDRLLGQTKFGAGTIVLANGDGDLDYLLAGAEWDNKITILVGHKTFERGDYREIFIGYTEQPTWDLNKVTLRIRDAQVIFNRQLQQVLLANAGDATNKPAPTSYGWTVNVSPTLLESDEVANTYKYKVHYEQVAKITVYFAGILATEGTDFTVDLANGEFTLLTNPLGVVTATVEAQSGYTASEIIKHIATDEGGLTWPDDFVVSSFDEVNIANPTELGLFVATDDSGMTVSQAIDWVITSIGGFWGFDRFSRLRIGIIGEPINPEKTFTQNEILNITRKATPINSWRTRLNFRRNWTVFSDNQIAGAAGDSQREYLKQQYRTRIAEDPTVQAEHPLAVDFEYDTLMTIRPDASTEAARQQALHGEDSRAGCGLFWCW